MKDANNPSKGLCVRLSPLLPSCWEHCIAPSKYRRLRQNHVYHPDWHSNKQSGLRGLSEERSTLRKFWRLASKHHFACCCLTLTHRVCLASVWMHSRTGAMVASLARFSSSDPDHPSSLIARFLSSCLEMAWGTFSNLVRILLRPRRVHSRFNGNEAVRNRLVSMSNRDSTMNLSGERKRKGEDLERIKCH